MKNKRVKKGNKKLMSETTATEKKGNGKDCNRKNEQWKIGQPENWATKNGPVGKKGNTK